MLKLAEMSLEEGLDLVVAVREKRADAGVGQQLLQYLRQLPDMAKQLPAMAQQIPGLAKQLASTAANVPGQLQQSWEGIDQASRDQLIRALTRGGIGAGAGAMAGGLSSLNQEPGRRTPGARAMTGAMLGGLGGGLGSLLLDSANSPELSRLDPLAGPPQSAADKLKASLQQPARPPAGPPGQKTPGSAVDPIELPDVPGLVPTGRRNFELGIDSATGAPQVGPDGKPALNPNPQGDISIPQYPAGTTADHAHPNNNWGDTLPEKAMHLLRGAPESGFTGSDLLGPGIGGAAGGAAGALAGNAASNLPTQSRASALQSMFRDPAAAERVQKLKMPKETAADLDQLYTGLGRNRAAAKSMLSQGAQAGITPQMQEHLDVLRRLDTLQPGSTKDRLLAARKAMLASVDPKDFTGLAARGHVTPGVVRDAASAATRRLGFGRALSGAGGLAGTLGGMIGGRYLQNMINPTATQDAAKAQLAKMRELLDPADYTSPAVPPHIPLPPMP